MFWQLWRRQRQLSDEAVARQIGKNLPEVQDKLLNYIQLRSHATNSQLAQAGLLRRSKQLGALSFIRAIPWRKNYRYLRYFLPVCGSFTLIWLIQPDFITQSSKRIYHYERTYAPPAPFYFLVDDAALVAFAGEPYVLDVQLKGKYLPEQVYVVRAGRYISMQATTNGHFSHRFEHMHKGLSFHFEADGHRSNAYSIRYLQRPSLVQVSLQLHFPTYTRLPQKTLSILKHMEVPEGTTLKWALKAQATDNISLHFYTNKDSLHLPKKAGFFTATRRFLAADNYRIVLNNPHATNKTPLHYQVNVRKDAAPRLYPKVVADTLLYKLIVLTGYVTDDYGVRAVYLSYNLQRKATAEEAKGTFAIPFLHRSHQQGTFHTDWQLDSLRLAAGDVLNYRIHAWDNDGIHGSKATFSPWYQLHIPNQKQINAQLQTARAHRRQSMEQSYTETQQLHKQINALQKQLKLKKELNWQDKKQFKKLFKQYQQTEKKIQALKEKQALFEKQNKRFEPLSEKMQEEINQLHNLMDNLLDPETKQLYKELQQLLQKRAKLPKVQSMLEKLADRETLQSKHLARALASMQRIRRTLQAARIAKQLQALADKQKALRTGTKTNERFDSLAQKQEELQKDFDEIVRSIQELNDLYKKSGNGGQKSQLQREQAAVKRMQAESRKQLQQKAGAAAEKAQENVEKSLQEMQKNMQEQQAQARGREITLDRRQMEKTLDNLIHLSLEQERLIQKMAQDVSSYTQHDILAQAQFDIQQATKPSLDSLETFALRNPWISAELTKEIHTLKHTLTEVMENMRERLPDKAQLQQRHIMTSFNKLALFVSELLEKLTQAANQGGNTTNTPKLSDLQQQLLRQVQQVKKRGKKEERLSEELVRMIAQQEAIRRYMEGQYKSREDMLSESTKRQQLLEEMKKIEHRLAHKEISDELIKSIAKTHTRLLSWEQAQETDKKSKQRKGEKALDYGHITPRPLSPYVPKQRTNMWGLAFVPLPLNPYYEQEVHKYLQRLQKK